MTYESALARLALERPELVVMTAENRAHIRSLPALLAERFIDVGIAEQTLIGMAAGLALRGRIPVVHALAPFLTMRAFEFIRTDLALPGLPAKLVGMIPGVLSDGNGPTHQAVEDIALMRLLPGMHVFCPADVEELSAGLPAILDAPGPCYVRYTGLPRTLPELTPIALGEAEVLARGSDVTLLSYGLLAAEAVTARELLEREGIRCGVVNVRWLSPLDERTILDLAGRSRQLVVVEDHVALGGLYSAVTELLMRERLHRHVLRLGLSAAYFSPGRLSAVLENEGLSGPRIASRVLDYLRGL